LSFDVVAIPKKQIKAWQIFTIPVLALKVENAGPSYSVVRSE